MGVMRSVAILLMLVGSPMQATASPEEHSAVALQSSSILGLDCWQGRDAWLPGTIQANDLTTSGSVSNDTGSSDGATCDYA